MTAAGKTCLAVTINYFEEIKLHRGPGTLLNRTSAERPRKQLLSRNGRAAGEAGPSSKQRVAKDASRRAAILVQMAGRGGRERRAQGEVEWWRGAEGCGR